MFPYKEYKDLCALFNNDVRDLADPKLVEHYNELKDREASLLADTPRNKELTWAEYVKLAIRTESIPANSLINCADSVAATRLLHAALGICTELAELEDGETISNFVEEVGDVYWYLAIADDVLQWKDYNLYFIDNAKPEKDPSFYLGEIQDVIKRHIFYGKELDHVRIKVAFDSIAWHLEDRLVWKGFKVGEAWTANIIKLEKRYPEKFFDAKAAIHRDVDRELEHISETGKVLTGEVELGEPMDKETIMETFFPINQVQLSFQGFNDLARSLLTLGQIEKMAMDLAFVRAQQYRKMGALELARGYDAMYKSYSGKGDRLEDYSLAIMWQEAGYSMDEQQVKERLERWK